MRCAAALASALRFRCFWFWYPPARTVLAPVGAPPCAPPKPGGCVRSGRRRSCRTGCRGAAWTPGPPTCSASCATWTSSMARTCGTPPPSSCSSSLDRHNEHLCRTRLPGRRGRMHQDVAGPSGHWWAPHIVVARPDTAHDQIAATAAGLATAAGPGAAVVRGLSGGGTRHPEDPQRPVPQHHLCNPRSGARPPPPPPPPARGAQHHRFDHQHLMLTFQLPVQHVCMAACCKCSCTDNIHTHRMHQASRCTYMPLLAEEGVFKGRARLEFMMVCVHIWLAPHISA